MKNTTPAAKEASMLTPRPITVRQRTNPGGNTGWEAVTIAPIVTTHTIGLRSTPAEVVSIVERMIEAGMMDARPIEVVA